MGRRRAIANRIASLGDIDEILEAMKNLALAETRRLAPVLAARRAATAAVGGAVAAVSADGAAATPGPGRTLLCVIGAERAFCGNFLDVIQERARAAAGPRTDLLLVGSRLADAWGDKSTPAIVGASLAEEVPAVLASLVTAVNRCLATPEAPTRLAVLYGSSAGPQRLEILPLPPLAGTGCPVDTLLTADALRPALSLQFIDAVMHLALLESLLAENEARLQHMENATRRLGERLDELGRRFNRLRQEEITEEIEMILLAAGSGDD